VFDLHLPNKNGLQKQKKEAPMKKVIISGLGLVMVALMAMPAAADRGDKHRWDGYKTDKQSQYRHSDKKNDYSRHAYKKDLKRERREFQKDKKHNKQAMKRADSLRERKRIHRNMVADWQDYKHDVRKIKRNYHQQKHYGYKDDYKHHRKGYVNYQHNHQNRTHGPNYLAFGWWF
jgi:Ni/Co efflux regulator RcnB